jgi:ankyrin repeat protein
MVIVLVCHTNWCNVVECLLSSGADINLCDEDGESPLCIALNEGHYDVVKYLLSSGADIKCIILSSIL